MCSCYKRAWTSVLQEQHLIDAKIKDKKLKMKDKKIKEIFVTCKENRTLVTFPSVLLAFLILSRCLRLDFAEVSP